MDGRPESGLDLNEVSLRGVTRVVIPPCGQHPPHERPASAAGEEPVGKGFMWALVGMLVLACSLRVAALLSLATTLYFDAPRLDEAAYYAWASQLASGTYQSTSAYQFARCPPM